MQRNGRTPGLRRKLGWLAGTAKLKWRRAGTAQLLLAASEKRPGRDKIYAHGVRAAERGRRHDVVARARCGVVHVLDPVCFI